jgi:hypothetical protein
VESLHDYLKSRTDGDGKPLVNFKEITASSFDVHIVAVLRIPDGDEFTAVQEEINYIVLEKMKQFGCDFAPGANTLVVEKL